MPHTDLDAMLGPPPSSYAQPEAVVLRLRRHGRRLVLPVLVLIVVAAAAGFWVGALSEPWMNLAAAAGAALAALLLGVVPILLWLTRRVTVTTRRVILRHGVFVRHRSEVALSRVREVRSRRTPGQRLFGSGSIDLLVGSESIRIEDVPGAGVVTDALQELVERNYEHSTRAFGMPGVPGAPAGLGTPGGAGTPSAQAFPAAAGHDPTAVFPQSALGGRPPAADPSAPVSFW
ncbi:PH domain-containing protein [Leucobacter ruminantium]|uniref:PH domain-containing protein n=1 Tax=Leucobacter ruminantium TaxID=1289170 RepID=A0A939LVY4_9MICO|nr:PH domain-containing protein [Leucobacter ruminantium]MBO1805799.1 PH domain-containing protein [Leucobacter ruminantium]